MHDNADYVNQHTEVDGMHVIEWCRACQNAAPKCKRCEQPTPHRWRGRCARCYLHAGGSQ